MAPTAQERASHAGRISSYFVMIPDNSELGRIPLESSIAYFLHEKVEHPAAREDISIFEELLAVKFGTFTSC